MKCLSQNCISYIHAKKRTIALVLLICFVVVSLLSETFILIHANHVHDSNGVDDACTTCAQIQNAENILKQLSTAVVSGFVVLAKLYVTDAIVKTMCFNRAVLTPVTLKTRMNN